MVEKVDLDGIVEVHERLDEYPLLLTANSTGLRGRLALLQVKNGKLVKCCHQMTYCKDKMHRIRFPLDDLWAMKSEDVGLIVRAISFQDFQPMWS